MTFISRRNPNKIKLSGDELLYQVFIHIMVIMVVIMCIFPFLYVVGTSLTSQGELIERNYFVIIPRRPTLRAYRLIANQPQFFNSLLVSIARTVLGVFAALALTVPGGYILGKRDLPGHKYIMIFFIITMILSGGLIPSYILMGKLRLINTFWVYIVPAFGGTFNMLIVKIFVEGIPNDIIESADLDGASELQKFINIAIPLLIPTICALGLFAAVAHWNSWFDAMLYVRDPNLFPIQYLIRNLLVTVTISDTTNKQIQMYERVTPESAKMAAVVIAVIPILCVYPFLQKYFIYGVFTGSVKG
ncbi:MAG: carbohydrate ABC transporter permease [Clostridiales bacterium]|jgi:putative aldouronate transport system permease protein|nr:carbohydrate ABC transporter permease [Clostridiales bacterium]